MQTRPGQSLGSRHAGSPRSLLATALGIALFGVTSAAAAQKTSVRFRIPGGRAVGFYRKAGPNNVYLAYPGLDYQIEVFAPKDGVARRLVRSGQVRVVRTATTTPRLSNDASPAATALPAAFILRAISRP